MSSPESFPVSLFEAAEHFSEVYPSAAIVGSLGRAAWTGEALSELRPSGRRRDIDAVQVIGRHDVLPGSFEGVEVDNTYENWIRTENGGIWLVYPEKPSIAVEVPFPEEVFEIKDAEINGSKIRTFRPEVIAKIHSMNFDRPKDIKPTREYEAFLSTIPEDEKLPPELLKPFEDFKDHLNADWAIWAKAATRFGYHFLVPERLRYALSLNRRVKSARDPRDNPAK